jgi:hypothetical protein
MHNESLTVAEDFLQAVFTSQHVTPLFSGEDTHEPATRLAAQLVRHTTSDEHIGAIIRAALPVDYRGNTLKELPEMIRSARAKEFDKRLPKTEKGPKSRS